MSGNRNEDKQNFNLVAEVLSRPEIQSSIANALDKLPDMMEKYDAIDRMLTFVKEVVSDTGALDYLLGGLKDDLPPVHFSRATLESAVILLDKLPKVTKYVQVMEQLFDTVEAVATDKQSLEYLVNGVREIIEPWRSRARDGVSLFQEAQQRAAHDTTFISIFSLLKLLKDPSMQKGIRLFKAFLQIVDERVDEANDHRTFSKRTMHEGMTSQF